MKILILGSKGQLGLCLQDQLVATELNVVLSSRLDNDVADFSATTKYILGINPDVVINASAYTAVDAAEKDLQSAERINHLAVENIAKICLKIDCWLLHISTDYVFDGLASTPYDENHECNPQTVYGQTKLRGELAIKRVGCKHMIIRTAWIFSEYGNNFLTTMLKVGVQKKEIDIVADQVGCPTYAQDLAISIYKILPLIESDQINDGIYNYCGDSPCSWHEFAQLIFLEAEKLGMSGPLRIRPVLASDYITQAVRPAYSVLNCQKIQQLPTITASDWKSAVLKALKKLI